MAGSARAELGKGLRGSRSQILPRGAFRYVDKGRAATIGRRRAVIAFGRLRLSGLTAWLAWLAIHIYYLVGFRNRLFVVLQWAWSYLTFRRGARLIVDRERPVPAAAPREGAGPARVCNGKPAPEREESS